VVCCPAGAVPFRSCRSWRGKGCAAVQQLQLFHSMLLSLVPFTCMSRCWKVTWTTAASENNVYAGFWFCPLGSCCIERSVVAELMGAAVQQLGSCCWPTASFERGDTQRETRGRGAVQGKVQAAIQQLWSWRESPRAVPGRSFRMCS
jgi:hypothetical protein